MPITASEEVTHSLHSVSIHDGGHISVTIVSESTVMPQFLRTFEISSTEAGPYWMSEAPSGIVRWNDLCGILYQILITRGDISGNIV